jgi:hypothetical protein
VALPTVATLAVVINFVGLAAIVMINITATAGVHAAKPGLAGGILHTCQQVGAVLGVALLSVVATARLGPHSGRPPRPPTGQRAGLRLPLCPSRQRRPQPSWRERKSAAIRRRLTFPFEPGHSRLG